MEFDSVIVKVYPLNYNLHVVRLEKCQKFNYSLNLESGLALVILLVLFEFQTLHCSYLPLSQIRQGLLKESPKVEISFEVITYNSSLGQVMGFVK